MAFAALEEAAVDLLLHADGNSLADHLADQLGPRRAAVEWCGVVSPADDEGAITAEIDAALRHGCSSDQSSRFARATMSNL